jgi:transporter family protein
MSILNLSSWIIPALLALFFWGLWGFLTKLGAGKASPQVLMLVFALCSVALSFFAGGVKLKFDGGLPIAFFAGLTGALGFYFFYDALAKGPVTTVIPLTSLYIAISSILAMIFLTEAITIKKLLGLLSAILAIILLV